MTGRSKRTKWVFIKIGISLSLFYSSLVFSQEPYMVRDIWQGSNGGTSNVAINSFDSIISDNILYFPAEDGVHGIELWRSDGTSQGTWMVKDINPGSGSSTPRIFEYMNGVIYFRAREDGKNYQLWRSDGTVDGTRKVKDISFTCLINVNGTLFFNYYQQLWKSNGTPEGTVMVIDLNPNVDNCNIEDLKYVNGELYFNYLRGNGYSFWKSDGTKEGTVKIFDCEAHDIIGYNNELYFGFRSNDLNAFSRSNGTTEGTVIIKTFDASPEFRPSHLIRVRDQIFFMATTQSQGEELWKSDGTPEGTVIVKDIYPGSSFGHSPSHFLNVITKWNGLLFFPADDGTNGEELWKSDGTEQRTTMVKDIFPGFDKCSRPNQLTTINGLIYFVAKTDEYGYELWQTDGTEQVTRIVKDINPGFTYSFVNITHFNNKKLFFYADDGIHGKELWTIDLPYAQQITLEQMIDHILNRKPLPTDLLPYADENGDGCIDIADVILFKNMLD